MSRPQRWEDLSPTQQRSVITLGIVQLALLIAALFDLSRRDAAELRGRKGLWYMLVFVNYIGPLAYFLYGRKRSA